MIDMYGVEFKELYLDNISEQELNTEFDLILDEAVVEVSK